jgi:hypothetical protein
MQPWITLSIEQLVRDELALQRQLGACRRAASVLMPTLRRTGMPKKHPSPETPRLPKTPAQPQSDRP